MPGSPSSTRPASGKLWAKIHRGTCRSLLSSVLAREQTVMDRHPESLPTEPGTIPTVICLLRDPWPLTRRGNLPRHRRLSKRKGTLAKGPHPPTTVRHLERGDMTRIATHLPREKNPRRRRRGDLKNPPKRSSDRIVGTTRRRTRLLRGTARAATHCPTQGSAGRRVPVVMTRCRRGTYGMRDTLTRHLLK